MDTRFLESFVSVVEFGSMAEAGRRLNITAAGVAQRVRALEAEFGTELVSRVGRRVRPTEAGAAVFARARVLLEGIRELKVAAATDTLAGELRLGAISTALTGMVPDLMSHISANYPDFRIYVAPGTSVDLYKRVIDGDLDAAILVQPPFRIPKVADWHLIRTEPLLLIAPGSMDVSHPHELISSQPFIRYDRNHWGGRLADNYLRTHNIRTDDRCELDALEAIAVMVDRGLGVSLVPDWAPPWPEGLSLNKLPIGEIAYARHIGLVWTRSSGRLRLIRALLEQASLMAR